LQTVQRAYELEIGYNQRNRRTNRRSSTVNHRLMTSLPIWFKHSAVGKDRRVCFKRQYRDQSVRHCCEILRCAAVIHIDKIMAVIDCDVVKALKERMSTQGFGSELNYLTCFVGSIRRHCSSKMNNELDSINCVRILGKFSKWKIDCSFIFLNGQ